MTPKPEEKPNGLTREEAQLTLDKILKRYGIHPSDQPWRTRGKTVPLAAPKVETKGLLREPITSGPAAAKKPFVPLRHAELGPPLDSEWSCYLIDTPATANVPLSNESAPGLASNEVLGDKPKIELPTEYHNFHYLIRIVECAVTLHCQVTAESAADARDQVQRIPNLIEWREISAMELADIFKAEKGGPKIRRVRQR
jgi:hypothetical protein